MAGHVGFVRARLFDRGNRSASFGTSRASAQRRKRRPEQNRQGNIVRNECINLSNTAFGDTNPLNKTRFLSKAVEKLPHREMFHKRFLQDISAHCGNELL
jgi:hypothetical protein